MLRKRRPGPLALTAAKFSYFKNLVTDGVRNADGGTPQPSKCSSAASGIVALAIKNAKGPSKKQEHNKPHPAFFKLSVNLYNILIYLVQIPLRCTVISLLST